MLLEFVPMDGARVIYDGLTALQERENRRRGNLPSQAVGISLAIIFVAPKTIPTQNPLYS